MQLPPWYRRLQVMTATQHQVTQINLEWVKMDGVTIQWSFSQTLSDTVVTMMFLYPASLSYPDYIGS